MKQITIPPGTYVVAVSGGVDSMALFDMLRRLPGVYLVVAHVDHGIRSDSYKDRELVERVAMSHNVPFESIRLELGQEASEERARIERYKFLRHIKARYAAAAIITAHHKDDLLETATLNMIRGTGWRGLSSLRSTDDIMRPLLHVSKSEIVEYARSRGLQWREDSTNTDLRYSRNVVRHTLLSRLSSTNKKRMHEIIVRQNILVKQIDDAVRAWLNDYARLSEHAVALPRYQMIMLPEHVAHEVLQTVLRRVSGKSLPRPLVNRALLFSKVAKYGKVMPLGSQLELRITRHEVIVEVSVNVVS